MPHAFSVRFAWLVAIAFAAGSLFAAEGDVYREKIQPYMTTYCQECHAGEKAKGELDLQKYSKTADVIDNFRRWKHVIEFIRAGEMPPEESRQPSITESQQVVAAIESILISEAKKHANDPGSIPPRRFTNTEYNHAIRDLTGVDIRPTKDFPVDPAGGEGFDNTGEALRMSPNLAKKYLGAAQRVAEHLVLKPDGIVFAPFPVSSYNERKKLTEQAVIDFYSDHAVNVLDYLEAAWRYRHRGDASASVRVEDWAARRQLSGKYLAMVWQFLSAIDATSPLDREISLAWDALPAPTADTGRPVELLALQETILNLRRVLSPPPRN